MNSEKSTNQRPIWLGLLSLAVGAIAGLLLWFGGVRRHNPPPEPFSRTTADSPIAAKPASQAGPVIETPVVPNHNARGPERY